MLFKNQSEVGVKRWHVIILITVVITSLVLHLFLRRFPSSTIRVGEDELKVLVANNSARWYKGLSDRRNLKGYDGMIFVFPERGKHTMVMRNMHFPLDIVWIDGNTVVDVVQNIPLESGRSEDELTKYSPRELANIVLEMPAGFVEKNNIKIGDRVELLE